MNPTDERVFALDSQHYLGVFARYKLVLDHGEGAYVYDTQGRRYADFLGGIAVNVLGHAHPRLTRAIADQAGQMIHCSNLYYTQVQADVAAKLAQLSRLDRVFLGNSGAEANEGAIKLARKYAVAKAPDKTQIITANHSFHGRTLATLTATGQAHYHEGFGDLLPGFDYVDFNDLDALAALMSEKTCAVMLETIQGEGGVHVPSDDYLRGVRELCDRHDACLILDEIQCGMGRTGTFFAYEQCGITPDIVTLAKGLAGGVPIGAVICTEKVARAMHPGDHGSTFGGNPLACAAARVVLDEIARPEFLRHVRDVGAYFRQQLEQLAAKFPALMLDVRGRGLMLGAELAQPGREIVNDCLGEGVIINCTAGNVLRFVPPLIIGRADVDALIAVLTRVLARHAPR